MNIKKDIKNIIDSYESIEGKDSEHEDFVVFMDIAREGSILGTRNELVGVNKQKEIVICILSTSTSKTSFSMRVLQKIPITKKVLKDMEVTYAKCKVKPYRLKW